MIRISLSHVFNVVKKRTCGISWWRWYLRIFVLFSSAKNCEKKLNGIKLTKNTRVLDYY